MSDCSFMSATSQICQNCKCNNTHLQSEDTVSNHTSYGLIASRKRFSRLYLLQTVKVCVRSIRVISQLALNILDYIMYLIFMNTLITYLMLLFKRDTASQMRKIALKKGSKSQFQGRCQALQYQGTMGYIGKTPNTVLQCICIVPGQVPGLTVSRHDGEHWKNTQHSTLVCVCVCVYIYTYLLHGAESFLRS